MSALAVSLDDFDPLVELAGLWTTEFADHYLPIDGAPPARYEAVDGKLVMSPREGSANSWAALELAFLLREAARNAGFAMYGSLNVAFSPGSWIEPDLVVLRRPVSKLTWVPVDLVLMPVEFVSPSSRRRDRIDKPMLAAKAGVPFYLRVEIGDQFPTSEAHLYELRDGKYQLLAAAANGTRLESERPFPISFDPADLLEP